MNKKIALIGCGAAAKKYYLPGLKLYPDIANNLIFVDVDIATAKNAADEFGNSNYTDDYSKLLGEIDGVIIAVPHQFHFSIAKDFLINSTHVLCEKPLAESPEQVKKMIELAKKNNVKILVNNTRRLFPAFREVKKLLDSGRLGKLESIKYVEANKFAWESETGFYVYHKFSTKGILLDLGAHVLDLLCWWVGEKPKLVKYYDDSFGGPESLIFFESKVDDCHIEVRLNRHLDIENYFTLVGSKGSIYGSLNEWKSIKIKMRNEKIKKINLKSEVQIPTSLVNLIIKNFLDIVEYNKNPIVSGESVLPSIELIEECYNNRNMFDMPWNKNLERLISA